MSNFGFYILKKCTNVAILNKRAYSILPPEWLGGYIGRRILEPIENLKSLDERLKEMKPIDKELAAPIDIGLPFVAKKASKAQLHSDNQSKLSDLQLEQDVRLGKFQIPVDEVERDWMEESGPSDEMDIAKHYAIYDHLFDGASFMPIVQFRVLYDAGDDEVIPVYMGNEITPTQVIYTKPYTKSRHAPSVVLPDDGHLYTLVMSNPDSHLQSPGREYIHWMLANINGADVSSADTVVEYMPTFPMRGTGFHRIVFTLYRHSEPLQFSSEKRKSVSLADRTFSSKEFYSTNDSQLTPVGLLFFQSEHDGAVKDVFHNVLNMKEPSFEYKHPAPYHPPQVRYPHYEPFDRYYDRYRDSKDIAEETLKLRLSREEYDLEKHVAFRYPLVHRDKNRPSWLQQRDILVARRREQYKDL